MLEQSRLPLPNYSTSDSLPLQPPFFTTRHGYELFLHVYFNPLNANDANRRHRIRKRVSANDAFRRHRLARAIRVVFLYLRASERNVTLGARVAVVGPSHSYLIVSSGRTRGAKSTAALCAKFHAVLLD